ncbi:MAG TPA: UDP-N-acetylmuramoyl-L-alanyl-D-glutamate--2,6-diaminopimelate ligase [Thermoanaerobaculia bacterium]
MELAAALPDAERISAASGGDPTVLRIESDSRRVRAGDLFVAIRGEKADGLAHAADAIARGAVAVVSDRPSPAGVAAPWIRVPEPRRAMGLLAARLAGDPAERLVLAGVTGTNGKTTTTTLLEAILGRHFGGAGFLGTVGYRTPKREVPADRTTPESTVIQALLAEMVRDGAKAAAMEVSSHALMLERVAGCRFDVAVFTNLTRDHLDYHGDMESYFAAKRLLFALRKPGAAGVVNADDPYGRRLLAEEPAPMLGFSPSGSPADVMAENAACDLSGTRLDVVHGGGRFALRSPLAGRFNVANLLAAAAAGLALGIAPADIAAAAASVGNVPGRFERVEAGQPYPIVVDYAHTPDALERLLAAVRELTDRRILLVFGCGGDRDRGKRAPMGEIAGRMADLAIATSDNPRSERPEAILEEVAVGLRKAGATQSLLIPDRREAIGRAIGLAEAEAEAAPGPGPVVVVAGKGHETVQVIGDEEIPFDDRKIAAEFVKRAEA